MSKLIGGSIEVYLYENLKNEKANINIALNNDGSQLVAKRIWECDPRNADNYVWECAIAWPNGFCKLHLFSDNGEVEYEFETDDLVELTEYLKKPSSYYYID